MEEVPDLPKKGQRTKGSGRKPGTPNHVTTSVRDAVRQAFDEAGGVKFLVKLSKRDPRTFAFLLQKLVPQAIQHEISGPGGGPVQYLNVNTGVPDPVPPPEKAPDA